MGHVQLKIYNICPISELVSFANVLVHGSAAKVLVDGLKTKNIEICRCKIKMDVNDYIRKINEATDFNEKIKLRVKFKEKFPAEFKKYMKELPAQKQRPPLCYGCKHFVKGGDCELNLWPIGNVFMDVINYTCPSFEKK